MLLVCLVNGCASVPDPQCAGRLPLEPVVALTCRAASVDKQAQVDLGNAYANGNGVPRDLQRAVKLWQAAANATSDVTYVYSPAVGKEAYGRSIPVRSGVGIAGLPQFLLGRAYLEGLGVAASLSRARLWLKKAATAGYQPAAELLERTAARVAL
jgi:hypothetical protein